MAGLDGKALGATSALLVAAALAACSSGSPGDGTSSTAGNGGSKSGSTSVGTSIATSTSIATGTVGSTGSGGGAGGGMGGCNPPAAAGTFWAQTAQTLELSQAVSMCQYRGDVLLVVNTASV